MPTRYCPLCNRFTETRVEVVAPFRVLTCRACGFVHSVLLVHDELERTP